MAPVTDQIKAEDPAKRKQYIIDVFCTAYSDLMERDPEAWRGKYRKMAATPFAFYRGSAALFYADMARDDEPFANEQTARIWIQGDLHAANFGTYMNSQGVLVFDVNDFDEAYIAPFTWDVKRLVASLALLGYEKALSDDEIREMVRTAVRSYVDQVKKFASAEATQNFALTLSNTKGKLLDVLRNTRLNTRWGLLQRFTTIDNFDRRFILDRSTTKVDADMRKKVERAFEEYLTTIPESKRFHRVSYNIKDVVAKRGVGIGSAGLPSYNVLVEGNTQALENDIIIYMKQAQTASPSRVIEDRNIKSYFQHDGHRTVLSQRALQAYADPWLGYTTLDGAGQLVAEASPYVGDLDWTDINDMDDILELLAYLGQAVAKVHCVSDVDSDLTLVPFSTDKALNAVLEGREEEFVNSMVRFSESYGDVVRDDYRYFVDAFRNHQIAGL
ncbi:MAG: DUF2252 domain-containing protein [Chloroflexota bacterium]|nr:DUF2252 domain-containing protein [Chloroflexota bacterium]MDQ5865487.1 DUF2252 domain-containing protein [Chloroflexota bacterium]